MEINPIAAASCFLELVKKNFTSFSDASPTEVEQLFAEKLLKSFLDILTDNIVVESYELEENLTSQGSSWSQSSLFDENGDEIVPVEYKDCPLEKKVKILKMIASHPNWSNATIQARGGKEYKPQYKKRWEKEIQSGGTKFEKYKFIEEYTYDAFVDARKSLLSIKDSNLREWALQAAQTFQDDNFNFRASKGWVFSFKQKFGISSRKITRLVSRHEHRNLDAIMESAKKFQIDCKQASLKFHPDNVLNTDQTGFTYEMTSNRTLSHKGEKLTMGIAKSPKNLATHSYTVQYVISKSGRIVGDVFMCLQERSGKLGIQVEDNLFPASNVTLTCSKSGKLTTSLYEYFLDKALIPSVSEDFLLVIDSWSGQINMDIYADRFGKDNVPQCTVKVIPGKCTPYCQPLDTTFNRQLKYFARKICEEAAYHAVEGVHKDDEVTTRNNIIRMHSLLHNQLSAEIFIPMIIYCWFSSGLCDEKPMFHSVKEACFTFEKNESIYCEMNCKGNRFLKCATCRKILCFDCFFYKYHFHFD